MKIGVRIITLLLLCALLSQVFAFCAFAEDKISFSISSASVEAGDKKAEIFLAVDANPGHASVKLQLVTDLTVTDMQLVGNATLFMPNIQKGIIIWAAAYNVSATGNYVKITLAIPETAKAGDSWKVGLTVSEVYTDKGALLASAVTEGKVSIKGGTPPATDDYYKLDTANTTAKAFLDKHKGAVVKNKNGAALAGTAFIGTGCFIEESGKTKAVVLTGDVNGDGKISAADYLILKRTVLGTYTLKGASYKAGMIKSASVVAAVDYMMLKRIVLGTYTL